MDYKNTLNRVKRLEGFGFIQSIKMEELTIEESKHRAKYYRITEAGLFQLFLLRDWWVPSLIQSQLPAVLESHRDTLIFETLLYPIFEKETLTKVPSARAYKNHKGDYIDYLIILFGHASQVTEAIYQYLRNCCSEIYEYVKTLLWYRHESKHTMEDEGGLDILGEHLNDYLVLERDQLVMKILLLFQTYEKEAEQLDALAILAQDDNFMKVASNLHEDFGKGFKRAMLLGNRLNSA
jgi:hypothetical protein